MNTPRIGLGPLNFGGHIGASVSALVDGQLSVEAEERAWRHVLTCPGCRRLVEYEGWTKTRVATLAGRAAPQESQAPAGLLGSLYDVGAWAEVDELERASRRRRAVVAMVGAGSVGVAVLGLVALTTPPAGRGEIPGGPSPAVIRSDLAGSGSGSDSGSMLGSTLGSTLGAGTGATVGMRTGTDARASLRHASR